jgi:hypothetical protein
VVCFVLRFVCSVVELAAVTHQIAGASRHCAPVVCVHYVHAVLGRMTDIPPRCARWREE